MIAALKFLHIAALSIWCAGLVGLPLLLARHAPSDDQHRYSRRRLVTHVAYVGVVTPAAIITIALGTALIFLRDVFVPWMFVKLALVGLVVLAHAWLGHVAPAGRRAAGRLHGAAPSTASHRVRADDAGDPRPRTRQAVAR